MRLWLAPLLLLVCPAALAQEYYTWRDANGVAHFSDSAPPAGAFKVRELQAGRTQEVTSLSSSDQATLPTDVCARARINVDVISQNPTVSMDLNNDGESELLTADQRQAQLDRARAQVLLMCKPETPANYTAGEASNGEPSNGN